MNSTQLTREEIFDPVLSVVPVLNQDTIYTAIMSPGDRQETLAMIRTLKPRD